MQNKSTRCGKCKRRIRDFPFKCAYCKRVYCGDHHLPEEHNCESLKRINKKRKEEWKDILKESEEEVKIINIDEMIDEDNPLDELYSHTPIYFTRTNDKNWKPNFKLSNFLTIIFLLFLGFMIFVFLTTESRFSNVEGHVDYYTYLPITYAFSENSPCIGERKSRVVWAFNIIEEQSDYLVQFNESLIHPNIEITCYDELVSIDAAGYGGIESYVGEQKILKGTVELFNINHDFEYCMSYPQTEVHEILHALGFAHLESRQSIMNESPKNECYKIEKEVSDCLKHIYGNNANYTCSGIPFL